ncbi:Sphingosine-1-phosphate lyase [Chlamydiales bacterium SCGC AG-110-P3]|nr:Sphingosine-1-phosphate lyase [Chlamydiales bacterium SCGC AG-110-P3]
MSIQYTAKTGALMYLEGVIQPIWSSSNDFFTTYDPTLTAIGTSVITLVAQAAWRTYCNFDCNDVSATAKSLMYRAVRWIPSKDKEIKEKFQKIATDIEKDFQTVRSETRTRFTLPENGLPHHQILTEIGTDVDRAEAQWQQGSISGTVYGGNDKLDQLITKTYQMTHRHNPLHFGEFPNMSKLEAEIASMVGGLFGGDDDVRGLMTSGGTDSIMQAMAAYRNKARDERNINNPVMIVPITAHAAFTKGAKESGIRLVTCRIDERTRRVSIKALDNALYKYGKRVIAVAGSAPAYPDGIVDPIQAIAELTKKHSQRIGYPIGLHVDACLGSFVIPFITPVDEFGFPIPEVTSISVDTHKYGLTSKGSSVILWRNEDWIRHMLYAISDWQGGIYGTPSRLGSRPGASIATAYATLCAIGRTGYEKRAKAIVASRQYLQNAINTDPKLDSLKVVGDPQLSVIAFKSDRFNIYTLADKMKERGHWVLNKLQDPQRIHFCLTNFQTKETVLNRFLEDLKVCVAERLANPNEEVTGDAEIYCTAQKIPFDELRNSVVNEYLLASMRLRPKHAIEPTGDSQ